MNPTDIAGYNKLNKYQTFGDILRVNKDLGFGTLRVGGLLESSWAQRHILNYDLTTGQPDIGYAAPGTNISYIEPSRWIQYQVFADFEWRPTDRLTLTPGINYLGFNRSIDSLETKSGVLYTDIGSRNYSKPLFFFTGNYRLTDHWSVYAQAASGFLIPPVKTVAARGGTTSATSPEQTVTIQAGTVYTAGPITADFDYYHIAASNVLINESGTACRCYVNAGSGEYSGIEAQGAYNFGHGLTLFANGSINTAKNTNQGDGTPGGTFTNAPKGTAAGGVIYDKGPWEGSVSDKLVGAQLASDGATHMSAYNTVDASLSYDFGKFKLKTAVFNIADSRAQVDFDGLFHVYQVGRQVQVTVEVKF